VHRFAFGADGRLAAQEPLKLGHTAGNGIDAKPEVAGLAVSPSGKRLLVANYQNDSVSLVDLESWKLLGELDLRPGKLDAAQHGTPGGTYPYAVAWASDDKAYVGSQRDREVLVLGTGGDRLSLARRIAVAGQPNQIIASHKRDRLFVACDNADSVVVLDTADDRRLAEIPVLAPAAVFLNPAGLKGANPNGLALSPDDSTLFVSDGGLNAVAVVHLGPEIHAAAFVPDADGDDDEAPKPAPSGVIGLIPTGWYPNAVALSQDGRRLFVANGKSEPVANPEGCGWDATPEGPGRDKCLGANQYILALAKAGFLAMPLPSERDLARLTWQVAANDNFPAAARRAHDDEVMEFVRRHIRHVVYIIKENRTYDQVLGDLERGNGDPRLTIFPEPISPNHHKLARQFVTLDNFLATGEVSATGWNWVVAARTTDFTEKTTPVNYAERGLQYDWQGYNRGINVGIPTLAGRIAANPATPDDPDLVPGTADVAAPDSAAGEAGAGYIWDAALKAGLSLRNYGVYGDDSRNYADPPQGLPALREAFKDKTQVYFSTKPSLTPNSDIYYQTFDLRVPDFWRQKEWQREFDHYAASGELPALTLLYYPRDHFGSFDKALDKANTVETEMADNDYAVGATIERIARSPFAKDTLIFILEDDPQDGADHISAYRSIAFVAGPYVRQGAVLSQPWSTVNMVRTIEAVLGLPPLGLNDGLAQPMTEIFDPAQAHWDYAAEVPEILHKTDLPVPAGKTRQGALERHWGTCFAADRRDAAYWTEVMKGQDFTVHDRLDTARFNLALWRGLQGEAAPLPTRSGLDLSRDRAALLAAWRREIGCP
jgi:DNA-binding beta-propeller fold protein YncE